jgi:hypothetical protein
MKAKTLDKEIICYCFGHSVEDIRDDVLKNGRSLIMASILEAKKVGECDCGMINPKGR